jgi:hypothetical protein
MAKFLPLFILIFILLLPLDVFSQLIWSTYLNQLWSGPANRVDNFGNSYIASSTLFSHYPITPGAYDTSYNGFCDIVVSKLNQTASDLIFSTFIGGDNLDNFYGMRLDNLSNIYITGYTYSKNFPITKGAFDTSLNFNENEKWSDGFITKLNQEGNNLIFSTYIGSQVNDRSMSIDIDKENNIYVFGYTYSNEFITTPGAYNKNVGAKGYFLSKLNPECTSLNFSTMIFYDTLNGIHYNQLAVDTSGNPYLAGSILTYNIPTSPKSFCPDKPFGGPVNFIIKFDSIGSSILFSTYINVVYNLSATAVCLNNYGEPYITGTTNLNTYPTSTGAYDNTFHGNTDIYITKINNFGDSLLYSTFLGGSSTDYGGFIILDDKSNIYITGSTDSRDFPITKNTYDSIFKAAEAYICTINSEGNKLLYSSYIGGTLIDFGTCLSIDKYHFVYLSGGTESLDFPTTPNVFNNVYSGDPLAKPKDIFLSKFKVFAGEPQIQSIDKINFPGNVCSKLSPDTIYIKNTGASSLRIDSVVFIGKDSALFSLTTENMPIAVYQGDSVRFIVNFKPKDSTGARAATLKIYNNTSINPYIINLSANYDTISYKINDSESDTLLIDLGTCCPGKSKIDTTITIFNKSSIGTTFKIENKDPQLQITPVGKAGKKEGDKPKKK